MYKKYSGKLYCFSPPVMLATFVIEMSFILYVIWRYKMTIITRLIVLILACLGIFQASEYMICGGIGIHAGTWSRLGYAAITFLPPLGIHLVHVIAGKKNTYLITAAYATAIAFVGYFVFATGSITGQTCYANYAVLDTAAGSAFVYGLYYYGWLFVGVGLALAFAQNNHLNRRALRALAFGYLAFILPTTTANIIDPQTISAIPSIMCGFAVLLAFALVTRVAPESIVRKDEAFSLRAYLRLKP